MEAKDYNIIHYKDGNLYINRSQWTKFRSDDSKRFSKEDLESIEGWIEQNNEYIRKDAFIEKACDAYCAICDTKECEGCAECAWVIKFRRQLLKY